MYTVYSYLTNISCICFKAPGQVESEVIPNLNDPTLLQEAVKDITDVGTDDLKDLTFKSYLNDALETITKKEEEELLKAEEAKCQKAAQLAEAMHKCCKAEIEKQKEFKKQCEREIKAEMQVETQKKLKKEKGAHDKLEKDIHDKLECVKEEQFQKEIHSRYAAEIELKLRKKMNLAVPKYLTKTDTKREDSPAESTSANQKSEQILYGTPPKRGKGIASSPKPPPSQNSTLPSAGASKGAGMKSMGVAGSADICSTQFII